VYFHTHENNVFTADKRTKSHTCMQTMFVKTDILVKTENKFAINMKLHENETTHSA